MRAPTVHYMAMIGGFYDGIIACSADEGLFTEKHEHVSCPSCLAAMEAK